MLYWILMFILPMLPLALFTYLAIKNKEYRIRYFLLCLIVSIFEAIFAEIMIERAEGLNGIMYVGTTFVGQFGTILFTIIILVLTIIKFTSKKEGQEK